DLDPQGGELPQELVTLNEQRVEEGTLDATASEPHRVRRDESGVEAHVEREAVIREPLDPPGARPDVDVGRLREIVWRRREQDIVRAPTDIGDGALPVRLVEVLDDLDADDEIVTLAEGLRGGCDAAVRPDVRAHLADRVLGDIDAEGLNAAVAEGLHEEA